MPDTFDGTDVTAEKPPVQSQKAIDLPMEPKVDFPASGYPKGSKWGPKSGGKS